MLYDTTFLLFCRMLYDVVLVWPPHATLLYSVLLARGQWKQFYRHISLLTGRTEIKKIIFFANFVSYVHAVLALVVLFNVFNLCPFTSLTIFYLCYNFLMKSQKWKGHFVMVRENSAYLEYF